MLSSILGIYLADLDCNLFSANTELNEFLRKVQDQGLSQDGSMDKTGFKFWHIWKNPLDGNEIVLAQKVIN